MHIDLAFFSGAPGAPELIVIFAVILLFFGPRRLPEIAKTIGKALSGLRRASQDFKDQIMSIDDESPKDITADVEYDDPYAHDEDDLFGESYNEDSETGEDGSAAEIIEEDLKEESAKAESKKEPDEKSDAKSDKAGGKKAGGKRASKRRPKQDPKG